jgi:hypothetical protein
MKKQSQIQKADCQNIRLPLNLKMTLEKKQFDIKKIPNIALPFQGR